MLRALHAQQPALAVYHMKHFGSPPVSYTAGALCTSLAATWVTTSSSSTVVVAGHVLVKFDIVVNAAVWLLMLQLYLGSTVTPMLFQYSMSWNTTLTVLSAGCQQGEQVATGWAARHTAAGSVAARRFKCAAVFYQTGIAVVWPGCFGSFTRLRSQLPAATQLLHTHAMLQSFALVFSLCVQEGFVAAVTLCWLLQSNRLPLSWAAGPKAVHTQADRHVRCHHLRCHNYLCGLHVSRSSR